MGAQWKHAGKTQNAATKGKVLGKLAKEIIVAAKSGADLASNSRLRQAVDRAKAASMTKDTIDRAIKKGAGLLDEVVNYETVVYEGFGPQRVPVIVECLTENKNRTASNIRLLFRKGQLGSEGSVSWDFKHQGVIEAAPPEGEAADPESAAIEAGAQDLEPGEDGQTRFFTEMTDLDTVSRALTAAKWTVKHSALGWKAKNPVTVEAACGPRSTSFSKSSTRMTTCRTSSSASRNASGPGPGQAARSAPIAPAYRPTASMCWRGIGGDRICRGHALPLHEEARPDVRTHLWLGCDFRPARDGRVDHRQRRPRR